MVAAFAKNGDFNEVREIQKQVLIAYEQDFSKHAPNRIVPRIRMLWNSIPSQLSKENKKFIYGLIRKGARAREYELAMMWLSDSGLIHRINRVTKPGMPLKAYEDTGAFKLYMLDTGLLAALSGLEAKALLDGNRIFNEFKGALTEQYVLQQLICEKDLPLFYWSAVSGTSEIDFIIQAKEMIVPVEVKASENLRAKSLKVYKKNIIQWSQYVLPCLITGRKIGWSICCFMRFQH